MRWFVQVCQFNNVSCGTFEAVTQRGYLTILTQNIGAIAADYQLQVRPYPPPLPLHSLTHTPTPPPSRLAGPTNAISPAVVAF